MDKSHRRIIRPAMPGDVWYVKLHASSCSVPIDTVTVLEETELTVLLKVAEDPPNPSFTYRYAKADINWVEFVRTVPRIVECEPCLITDPQHSSPQDSMSKVAQLSPRPPTHK